MKYVTISATFGGVMVHAKIKSLITGMFEERVIENQVRLIFGGSSISKVVVEALLKFLSQIQLKKRKYHLKVGQSQKKQT
jgi:hypothetical protein